MEFWASKQFKNKKKYDVQKKWLWFCEIDQWNLILMKTHFFFISSGLVSKQKSQMA